MGGGPIHPSIRHTITPSACVCRWMDEESRQRNKKTRTEHLEGLDAAGRQHCGGGLCTYMPQVSKESKSHLYRSIDGSIHPSIDRSIPPAVRHPTRTLLRIGWLIGARIYVPRMLTSPGFTVPRGGAGESAVTTVSSFLSIGTGGRE